MVNSRITTHKARDAYLIKAGVILIKRRRRWANIKPTLIQRHVPAG